jgi:hypothetical protein
LVKDDDVSCPKCKAKFSFLYTYRSLDGTLHEFPQVLLRLCTGLFPMNLLTVRWFGMLLTQVTRSHALKEESVCLLKRASWFEDALGNFKGKALAMPEEPDIPEEWYDEYFEEDDDDYDEYMASSGLVGREFPHP